MSQADRTYPLSPSEFGIYYECQHPTLTYNLPFFLPLAGFDAERMLCALSAFFDRHPCLFTQFTTDEDGSVRKHIVKTPVNVVRRTLGSLDEQEVLPFRMLDAPLFRVELCRVGNEDYLFTDFHHSVFDGGSIRLFLESLIALYDGKDLPAETFDANDFAEEIETGRASAAYAEEKAWFESAFGGLECEQGLPEDLKAGTPVYETVRRTLGPDAETVSAFVRKNGLRTSAFFLSSFAYLISRMNMENEALFATVHNGRDERLANTVGMFVRTFPFHQTFRPDESVLQAVSEAGKQYATAAGYRLYSSADCARDLSFTPSIFFGYQGDYFYKVNAHGRDIRLILCPVPEGKGDFEIQVHRDGGRFEFWCTYRSDKYLSSTVEHLIGLYDAVLRGFLSRERLSDIDLVDETERKLLDTYNRIDPALSESDKTVVDLFRENVVKYPDRTAVIFKDRRFTYAEADAITDRIAAFLSQAGIGKEDVVSVLIDKSEYEVLASLGVLKCGAAYQPLDPSYPAERLNFMAEDSDAKALILDRAYDGLISNFGGLILFTDEIPSLPDKNPPAVSNAQTDLFVMLYTSGTTGKPKGVMLEHGNIACFARYYQESFGCGPDSVFSAYASYGFDAHLSDIYPALISGGAVCVIPDDMRLDLVRLGEYYDRVGITHAMMTTQVGRQAIEEISFRTLKHFIVGGEKLVPLAPPAGYTVHNAYGPTEGTCFCCEQPLDRLYGRVPIGKRNSNYKCYIVDGEGRLLPRMCKGELWIAGPCVARGYRNRPEENAKAFLGNPFDSDPRFSRLYRTGDVVRMLTDGRLDFIGRSDGQVKVRGYRIELSEVEEIIRKFKGIRDATVKDFTDPSGVKYLAGYVVSPEPVDFDALAAFIGQNKPAYMIPAAFMQLDAIPLTQNQKVNKRALPEPELRARDITPPQNETEKAVFDLLSDILGHQAFGIDTDFGDAGLTSVSAIRFTVRLGKTFGRSFSNGDLEAYPTVRTLAAFAAGSKAETNVYEKLDSYPLTKTQEGVFIECLTKPGSTVYNIPVLFALDPAVDPVRLQRAVVQALNAHRYVLSVLITDENGDVRVRPSDGDPNVSLIRGEKPDPESLVRPFDILGKPLYRAAIYDCPDRPYLFLDFHHVLFDGTSMAVLLSDISDAYLNHPVEAETYSGYEIALDEQESRGTSLYEDAKRYFESLLAETDGDYLPKKALKTGEKTNRTVRRSFRFDRKAVEERIRKEGLSADALFNYFFGLTMTKYICRDDALYCAAYSGRSDNRRANVASMLVKTLPVYLKTDPEDDLADGVRAMKKQLDASRAFSVYSFAEIASASGLTADLLFVYQGDFFRFDSLCGLPAESRLIPSSTPKAALTFQVSLNGDELLLDLDYDGSVYDEPLVTAFARTYETLFLQFGTVRTVGGLNCLSDADVKMYAAFNATDEEVRDCPFHKLFEEQAERVPDKTAVIARDGSYTFRELNRAANRIAHALLDAGIRKGDFVAVVMPRVKDAYSARHGVLKAGAAFVPIDPKYPDERISYILESANAKAVISTKEIFEQKPDAFGAGTALRMDAGEMLKTEDCSNPDVPVSPSDMCYVIYTSGSTGKPKGVMIRHRNLVNYVVDGNNPNTLPHRRAGEDAVVACFASLSFDASLLEEAPALARGLTMVMASEAEIENPVLYAKTMIDKGVTLCFFTPSYVANALICKEFMEALRGLKGLMMGAEALPRDLYVNLREAGIDADIYNIYGPTETTICCTHATVTEPYITIGKPVANTKHYILDKHGAVLPIGAVGDLTICGNGVGAGYLNLPDMTKAKYITLDGLPAFRSGDIVRFNSEGNIEYFGRLDNQIKLHGLRIELDEIEKAIAAYPGIARAVVRVCKAEEDFLAGYFTASEPVDKQALTSFISSSLTPYMVPKILIQLDRMPLNPNGKIDKKALPEPVLESETRTVKPPKNSMEEKIVNLFRKALSRKEYGTDENFFDQGGTSLSVSKIAMMALTEGLPVAYRDVFDYPTPELLAEHILASQQEADGGKPEEETDVSGDALACNCNRYVDETAAVRPLGRVLLTGATGFLGAHVLKRLLDQQIPTVVLCRGGELDAETRLQALLAYYFDSPMEDTVASLVKVYDADITSKGLDELLKDEPIDTVVNCAAMVKHFAADDSIERVNVGGVKNMIALAEAKNARLVQISTLSVAGENVDGKFEETFRLHENQLAVGQDISNKYVHSKYMGEKAILEAIGRGLDAKIIRVGNLMGRQEDGEFQINSVTNSFIRNLRAYRALGCFPVSACDGTVDFSPIDEVAKAVLLLAQTDGKFTVYHCANAHEVQMGDVIETMNDCGFRIDTVPDAAFGEALNELLKDDEKNMLVSGLLTYSSGSRQLRAFIKTDNRFTVKALYRLGYKWPITDGLYLRRVIEALDSLGFFDRDDM